MASKTSKTVYHKVGDFGKILWEMRLDDIEKNVNSWKMSKDSPHTNFIEGLSQIISALDTFLDTTSQESENEDFCIIIYESVRLESSEIIRTSGEFQRKEWFSNVEITSAEDQEQFMSNKGSWYGKVNNFFSY